MEIVFLIRSMACYLCCYFSDEEFEESSESTESEEEFVPVRRSTRSTRASRYDKEFSEYSLFVGVWEMMGVAHPDEEEEEVLA